MFILAYFIASSLLRKILSMEFGYERGLPDPVLGSSGSVKLTSASGPLYYCGLQQRKTYIV